MHVSDSMYLMKKYSGIYIDTDRIALFESTICQCENSVNNDNKYI